MEDRMFSQSHRLGANAAFQPMRRAGSVFNDQSPESQAVSFIEEVSANPELKWQEAIVCPQTDPETFFPEKNMSARAAKKVCESCEAIEPCLEGALERNERFGVWGGKSERERRAIRKERKQAEEEKE